MLQMKVFRINTDDQSGIKFERQGYPCCHVVSRHSTFGNICNMIETNNMAY